MAAELRQILRMVTIEIVINSIRVMGVRVAMPVCVVLHGLYTGRIAAKRQTAGIKTHRPKIRVFAPQGRLVALIHIKLDRADGHVGPLGCAKFYLNHHTGGGNAAPKYQNFPLFDKKSSRTGDSLD